MTHTTQVPAGSKKRDELEEVTDQFEMEACLVVWRLSQAKMMQEGLGWCVRVEWVAMNQSKHQNQSRL